MADHKKEGEVFIGIEDLEVEIPEFETSDVADGLAAIETLFLHYQFSEPDQIQYFDCSLVLFAAFLVNTRTLMASGSAGASSVRVTAAIPVPTDELIERCIHTRGAILDFYRVSELHRNVLHRACLLYVSCELWNKASFPPPGLPDVLVNTRQRR